MNISDYDRKRIEGRVSNFNITLLTTKFDNLVKIYNYKIRTFFSIYIIDKICWILIQQNDAWGGNRHFVYISFNRDNNVVCHATEVYGYDCLQAWPLLSVAYARLLDVRRNWRGLPSRLKPHSSHEYVGTIVRICSLTTDGRRLTTFSCTEVKARYDEISRKLCSCFGAFQTNPQFRGFDMKLGFF